MPEPKPACPPPPRPHVQVRKSVRLKLLTRIEAFVDSPGQQEYFELTFAQVGAACWAMMRTWVLGRAMHAAACM